MGICHSKDINLQKIINFTNKYKEFNLNDRNFIKFDEDLRSYVNDVILNNENELIKLLEEIGLALKRTIRAKHKLNKKFIDKKPYLLISPTSYLTSKVRRK